jgi:hypothetical protein
VAGLDEATWRDTARLLWWTERGWWHSARRATFGQRAFTAYLALAWWPTWPLLAASMAYNIRRAHARYYLSPGRDAVLAVTATRTGWVIEDHMTAKPGAKLGRPLRKRAFPVLIEAADRDAIAVRCHAATAKLARIYSTDMPGTASKWSTSGDGS